MSPRRFFRPILTWLFISGAIAVAPAHSQGVAPDTMEARVMACVACHGQKGQGGVSPYFPRLAGQPAGYLFNQLQAFREAHRKYTPMNYLVTYLSDDYLREIAGYFSSQEAPSGPAAPSSQPPATLERGRTLVQGGDPSRNVPACIACHGAALGGRAPGIPSLLGLRAEYISAQLGAWRSGVRHAKAPDCMQQVAQRLTEADIGAVAAWLSSQAPTPDSTPAAATDTLPLACGSEQAQ